MALLIAVVGLVCEGWECRTDSQFRETFLNELDLLQPFDMCSTRCVSTLTPLPLLVWCCTADSRWSTVKSHDYRTTNTDRVWNDNTQNMNKVLGYTPHTLRDFRFRRDTDDTCALLSCYRSYSGNSLPKFRGNLSVPSSKFEK